MRWAIWRRYALGVIVGVIRFHTDLLDALSPLAEGLGAELPEVGEVVGGEVGPDVAEVGAAGVGRCPRPASVVVPACGRRPAGRRQERTTEAVPSARGCLPHRDVVVEVSWGLGEQPDGLVRRRGTVAAGLGHAGLLGPDDPRADDPAVGLHREGEELGDKQQGLGAAASAERHPFGRLAGEMVHPATTDPVLLATDVHGAPGAVRVPWEGRANL